MRILHVLNDLSTGGAERLVAGLARGALPHQDVRIAVVHASGDAAELFEGLDVRQAGRVRGRPGVRALRRLAALAAEVDIVHTHLWSADVFGRLAGALAGARGVVSTVHDTRGDGPWRDRLDRATSVFCHRLVAVSEPARAAAVARGFPPGRIVVVPNGVPLAQFARRPWRDAPVRRVLGLGRLTHQKGFDLLVEACQRLGLGVDLVGEGPMGPALHARGATLHGWRRDVRPYLAEADVVAIPSRWEAFGLVAVEALAVGVPVVASRVEGLASVVGTAGVLVDPEDVAALEQGLRRVRDDVALRRRLWDEGPVHAALFGLDRTVQCYDALYRDVLAEVGARRRVRAGRWWVRGEP